MVRLGAPQDRSPKLEDEEVIDVGSNPSSGQPDLDAEDTISELDRQIKKAKTTKDSPKMTSLNASIIKGSSITETISPLGSTRFQPYTIEPVAYFHHPYPTYASAATKNFKWIFTGGEDGYVRKYDVPGTLRGDLSLVNSHKQASFNTVTKAGVLLSAWDNIQSSNIPVITGSSAHISPIYSIAVHDEGVWCVTGTSNGAVNLWTIRHEEGSLITSLKCHDKPVSALCITPDQSRLVSGSWDRRIALWDLNTGARTEFSLTSCQITSIQLCPGSESNIFLASSYDGVIFVYDTRTSDPVLRMDTASSTCPPWCVSACWNADGSSIYCGRRNSSVDEFDFRQGGALRQSIQLPQNSGPVSNVTGLPNSKSLLVASFDTMRVVDVACDNVANDHRSDRPLYIVQGHSGNTISSTLLDTTHGFLFTTCGSRGFGGTVSNNNCLLYSLKGNI